MDESEILFNLGEYTEQQFDRLTVFEYLPDEEEEDDWDDDGSYCEIMAIDRIECPQITDRWIEDYIASWFMDLSLTHTIYNVDVADEHAIVIVQPSSDTNITADVIATLIQMMKKNKQGGNEQ